MSTEQMILDEVRSLRLSFDEFSSDARERITRLETHDHDISGNGQPGRMKSAESRLVKLESRYWYATGMAAGFIGLVDLVIRLWPTH